MNFGSGILPQELYLRNLISRTLLQELYFKNVSAETLAQKLYFKSISSRRALASIMLAQNFISERL